MLTFLARKKASKIATTCLFVDFCVCSILVAEYLSLCSEFYLALGHILESIVFRFQMSEGLNKFCAVTHKWWELRRFF